MRLAHRTDLPHLALIIQRREDGVLLVRVPSAERDGRRLPDAIFSFRRGDPQYTYWAGLLDEHHQDVLELEEMPGRFGSSD